MSDDKLPLWKMILFSVILSILLVIFVGGTLSLLGFTHCDFPTTRTPDCLTVMKQP